MPAPIFESQYALPSLVRGNFAPAEIADALKVNSGDSDFTDSIMSLSGLTVREGQWVAKNGSGLVALATSTSFLSWPVWQDPGIGRTDATTGGMTVLRGHWSCKTNVIGMTALAVGDELAVGTLGAGHAVLPSAGGGLVRLVGLGSGTDHMVVAHVEVVGADYAIVTNQNAGYPRAGGV